MPPPVVLCQTQKAPDGFGSYSYRIKIWAFLSHRTGPAPAANPNKLPQHHINGAAVNDSTYWNLSNSISKFLKFWPKMKWVRVITDFPQIAEQIQDVCRLGWVNYVLTIFRSKIPKFF